MINSDFSEFYHTDHLFRAAIDTLARLCLEAYERDLLVEAEAAPVGESECVSDAEPSIVSIAEII